MALKTPKQILKDILENLPKENLDKFRSALLDRKVVKTNQVEKKGFLVITDVMVEAYTERKALKEAEKILRAINCVQAADELAREAADLDLAPVPVGVVFPRQADQASNASLSDDVDLR